MDFSPQPVLETGMCSLTCCHTLSDGVSQPESAGVSGRLLKVFLKSSSMERSSCGSVIGIKFRFFGATYVIKDLSKIFFRYSLALKSWLLLVPMEIPN